MTTNRPAVRLRPILETDLDLFDRCAVDPAFSQPWEWDGFKSPRAARQRWEADGYLDGDYRLLAVALADDTAAGWVMFRDPKLFGRLGWAWEVGILLAPEHRGHGVGTAAQRLLADYLFATTTVDRLYAYTESDNEIERRSLRRCGFRQEGILVRAGFRDGRWRDAVLYARLRDDPVPP